LDPDVFVVDEIIGVGDTAFQEKCRQKMLEFRARKKTILLASHATGLLESMCDHAIWLEKGVLRKAGNVAEVMEAYQHGG
jgi:ABC-type polysaccharide/polyol phosphate transport system ATPase subunit